MTATLDNTAVREDTRFAGRGVPSMILTGVLGLVLGAGSLAWFTRSGNQNPIKTEYETVLLDNGSAYFGKVETRTSEYVLMRDIYYVQSNTNPDTRQVSSVLIRRGKEWHGPDAMMITRSHIVFLEPVAPDSTVAKLIAESRKPELKH